MSSDSLSTKEKHDKTGKRVRGKSSEKAHIFHSASKSHAFNSSSTSLRSRTLSPKRETCKTSPRSPSTVGGGFNSIKNFALRTMSRPSKGSLNENSQMLNSLDNYECGICMKYVQQNELAILKNQAYHIECYKCSVCNLHIAKTEDAHVNKQKKLICEKCQKPHRKLGSVVTPGGKLLGMSFSTRTRSTKRSQNKLKAISRGPVKIEEIGDPKQILSPDFSFTAVLEKIEYLKNNYKENAFAQVCTDLFLQSLENGELEDQVAFTRCVESGLKFYHSKVGAYAMHAEDFDRFHEFFIPLIRKVQHIAPNVNLKVDLAEMQTRYQKPFKKKFDLTNEEIDRTQVVGCNFRFVRNLARFPMMGSLGHIKRREFEDFLLPLFDGLLSNKEYGGEVLRITSEDVAKRMEQKLQHDEQKGHFEWAEKPQKDRWRNITEEEFHVINKRLDPYTSGEKIDGFLNSTQISKHWPDASGLYLSRDKKFRIYYNHEDHLEIVYSEIDPGLDLNKIYAKAAAFLRFFEHCFVKHTGSPPIYHMHPKLGFLTSCPTHVGSGFIPAISLRLKNLIDDGNLSIIAKEREFHYKITEATDLHVDVRLKSTMNLKRDEFITRVYPVRKLFESEEVVLKHLYNIIPEIMQKEAEGEYM